MFKYDTTKMAHVTKSHSFHLEFHKTSNTKQKCNLSTCTPTCLKISTLTYFQVGLVYKQMQHTEWYLTKKRKAIIM